MNIHIHAEAHSTEFSVNYASWVVIGEVRKYVELKIKM